MKTKQDNIQSSGLSSRPVSQQSGNSTATATEPKPTRTLPHVDYAERQRCRALPAPEVLAHLRRWFPDVYAIAEVVGKWVWVTFPEQPQQQIRAGLSQAGFHWNNARKCWQHPCGHFTSEGSGADPRQKYGTHFAADHDSNPFEYNGPARTAEQVAA